MRINEWYPWVANWCLKYHGNACYTDFFKSFGYTCNSKSDEKSESVKVTSGQMTSFGLSWISSQLTDQQKKIF